MSNVAGGNDLQRALTANECELLADTVSQEAAASPVEDKRESLLRLAQVYRDLARLTRLLGRDRAIRDKRQFNHYDECKVVSIAPDSDNLKLAIEMPLSRSNPFRRPYRPKPTS
jgi:hypothetical protein